MNKLIVNAIKAKNLLRLEYHGFYRFVEPHTYGLNQKNVDALSCYQVLGGSESNEPQGWKILLVHEIRAISMSDISFLTVRSEYKRDTETFSHIYAQL